LHHIRTSTYTGPELFNDCINKKYRQVFLGNSKENLQLLKEKFEEQKLDLTLFKFQELPFCKVEDFEYKEISKDVNDFNPDLVWVSLGAPKQEQFISMLFPFIEKGVLFAIGAAFNLYLGKAENKRAPKWMRQIHLEWLFRVFQEPKRVGKRAFAYLILLPKIIIEEKIRINTRRYETIS
jgi:N-acetylglucosaminyldiphosphoundecaprenol N-acetyl-beta-D-mannosaminyltransferase